ncbi:sialic acid synthase-like [Anneissia japonica]|uniref:sialic acid synthase-like n=1 Tax=Anneissia japonica TaxID=1529436 RepID=UPI0014254E57|nr:sialic acid synthase-like [Anneissia japonica]
MMAQWYRTRYDFVIIIFQWKDNDEKPTIQHDILSRLNAHAILQIGLLTLPRRVDVCWLYGIGLDVCLETALTSVTFRPNTYLNMPLTFELAPGRKIGGDHPCFIIAEIGQNHQGDIKIAKQLIKVAKDAGADCAKFQKSELDFKFNKAALAKPYTSKHSWGKTYGEHKRFLEFSHEQYRELKAYAEEIGIFFTASGMDEAAQEFLNELDVPFFKIGSGDTNNLTFLAKSAKMGRPMIISSGMQTLDTMKKVYNTVKPINENFCFLQCTSAYPLAPEDVHLRIMDVYRKEFPDIPVGYSGHESGMTITLAAVAMGAKVVERHITMDKTWKGNDHEASLEPDELTELIKQIRIVERAFGSHVKEMRECERPTFNKLGKSIVAAKAIPAGTLISQEHLGVKVAIPKGHPPENMSDLLGKRTKRAIEYDDSINLDDVVDE